MDYKIMKDLVSIINSENKPNTTKINGTAKIINNVTYVRLDGSEIYTPVTTAVEVGDGDRVSVEIKEHKATILSNITSPSVNTRSFNNLKEEVDENGNLIRMMDSSITTLNASVSIINGTLNVHDSAIQSVNDAVRMQGNAILLMGNDITSMNSIIKTINSELVSQDSKINLNTSSINAISSDISIVKSNINMLNSDITAINNTIVLQGNDIQLINNNINAIGNDITAMNNQIGLQNNKININTADITILNSGFVIRDGVLTGLSEIIVDNLKTDYLNSAYADIDFANINIAAIATLFSESGIIKDLIVQQGSITGELVGVTLKGDLIEANTLKADKLVVRGSDGLYYKLNIDGIDNISTSEAGKFTLTTSKPSDWDTNYKDYYVISNSNYIHVTGESAPAWTDNTYYKLNSDHESGLDGSTIIAHSVTADRIQVTDLVAFGATIGRFVIGNAAIYSIGKSAIDSNVNGVYLGSDGQIYIGDQNNCIKYYKDENSNWNLDLRANNIYMGSSSKTIEAEIDDQISELSDAIDLKVDQKTYDEGLDGIAKTFAGELKLSSDNLILNFSKSIQDSLGDVNDPNSINGTVSNINQNFLFSNSGLTISRSDSAMMLVLQNNEIDFVLKGNTDIVKAKMTSNSFILEELSTLQLGNFGFVVRSNGSIDFKKVK